MRKGGEDNCWKPIPAPGAKKYTSLCYIPKEFPGAYELGRFPNRDEAENEMNNYKSGKEFKFFHNDVEYSSLNVEGFYQISESYDSYLK